MSSESGHHGPQYYRPGPSSGHYPQYPQNPYPTGGGPTPGAGRPAGFGPDPQQQVGQWQQGWAPPAGGAPAGLGQTGTAPVPRPRQVVTSLILLLTSTVPFVFMGIQAMFMTINQALLNDAGIPRSQLAQVEAAGITMDQLTQLFRVMGGVFVVLALVYAVVAVVAFRGRPAARLVLAILTAVYGLPLLLLMAASPLALFAVAVLALAGVGVWLLYSQPAREWYAARKVAGRV
ncbi:hypothetical protein WIS52_08050 [Pseudonocardia nematodicida]|uniref:Uncharacterized protein n=1 Tax=Pseudonocardia nematodicida TaxID=1206997 RepID=A0ABV1K7F8_9PSEU